MGKLGARVLDADKVGHEVLREPEVCQRLVEAFGKDIGDEEGHIDRKKLGALVFSSPEALQLLSSITHPIILDKISDTLKEWQRQGQVEIAVVEAALLIEAGMASSVDKVVLVVADRVVQMERIIERNGLTLQEAAQRIDAQPSVKERLPFADYVIENNGSSLEELEKKVKFLWSELRAQMGAIRGDLS
jgi:dephospho-CoA kinase